jgi:hypothetical protein
MKFLMSRTRLAGVTSAALLAAVCIAAPFAGQQDLSSIPPEPAKVHSQLVGLKVGLAQAIDIAQKDTGGLAQSAQINGGLAEVVVFAADESINVSVDTATGEEKSKMEVPTSSSMYRWDPPPRYEPTKPQKSCANCSLLSGAPWALRCK